MLVQSDYETDLTLAVFRSSEDAAEALRRLTAAGVHVDASAQKPLSPGRYEVCDTSMNEEVGGALRGAEIGVPAGAVVGLGVAATMLGATPEVMAGMAGAGAIAGGVIGAFNGAVLRTHWDDDVAAVHEVPDEDPETLLQITTTAADGSTGHARRILAAAGAIAFLDPSTFSTPG